MREREKEKNSEDTTELIPPLPRTPQDLACLPSLSVGLVSFPTMGFFFLAQTLKVPCLFADAHHVMTNSLEWHPQTASEFGRT